MSTWWTDKLLAFDCETTGVDPHSDRIVTAALVKVRPLSRPQAHTWLINPGVDIPAEATAIHGITTEQAREEGVDPAEALFEIGASIAYPLLHNIPLVAFNAAFDLTMFEAECVRHGVPTLAQRLAPKPVAPIIDGYVLDKQVSRRKGKRTLAAQCEHHGIIHAGAHSCSGDALAAARLVTHLCKTYLELQTPTAAELHDKQVSWRAEQQTSLRDWLTRQGKPADDVRTEWPVIPTPAAEQAELEGVTA